MTIGYLGLPRRSLTVRELHRRPQRRWRSLPCASAIQLFAFVDQISKSNVSFSGQRTRALDLEESVVG